MADHPNQRDVEAYDSELNLRSIVGFSVGVIIVTLLAAAVMWWMSAAFKRRQEARDRAPSPIAEARVDPIPPGPRLQPTPPRDMEELRARDKAALTTYGWVDRDHGVARIPVDRAIEIMAQKGSAK
jgi:hypothetical protein